MPLLLLLLCSTLAFAAPLGQNAVVVVPVADVWNRPPARGEKPSDDLRETQVLYGEKIVIHQRRGGWVRIEALEQPEYTHHEKWEGYPGWVDSDTVKITPSPREPQLVLISTWTSATEPEAAPDTWLPLGSLLRPAGKANDWVVISTPRGERCLDIGNSVSIGQPPKWAIRDRILTSAAKMMAVSYLWGGLTAGDSPPQDLVPQGMKYGVDCSGLVHLSYRVNGITVPRDSYEQWMKATKLKRRELMPADLIFSAKVDHPKKVTHVALYAGNDQIIEAPQTGLAVRKIPFEEKYGKPLNQVESGDTVGERVVYFGTLLR